MLTLDTSGVIAAADPRDRFHAAVREVLAEEASLIIPVPILAETMFMLRRRLGVEAERTFLAGVVAGDPLVDQDVPLARVLELVSTYDDLGLSFADAAVVASAERYGSRILTLDRRDFDVVARGEASLTLLP